MQPRYVVALLSGGHDSLVATHVASRHSRFSFACHLNTGIGIEQTRDFVRGTCEEWGIELREYRASEYRKLDGTPDPQVYRELVCERGFPGPPMHWKMYQRLKERPLRMMLRGLERLRKERVLLVTGCRQQESWRRMGNVEEIQKWEGQKYFVAPLWRLSKVDVNGYIADWGLRRNEVVDHLHMSGECLCGAYAHAGELEEIRFWYPDAAEEIDEISQAVHEAGHEWGWEEGPLLKHRLVKAGLALCQSCEHRYAKTA